MKTLLLILAVAGCSAQETRRETVLPYPGDPAKPNSPSVPDVYAIPAKIDRVVILRFKYDTDLLAGLERAARDQKISNGVILAAAGSVRGYHVHQVGSRTFPCKNIYEKDPNAPADLVTMNGYIIKGRVHAHVTLSNPEKAFGGHLEPGTTVFTFAVVTVGILPDSTDLSRVDDMTYR